MLRRLLASSAIGIAGLASAIAQPLTDRELDILFRSVTDRLAGCREALATLALIRRVIAQRQAHRPKPGFWPRLCLLLSLSPGV